MVIPKFDKIVWLIFVLLLVVVSGIVLRDLIDHRRSYHRAPLAPTRRSPKSSLVFG
jgi:hypothetical protein